MPKSKQRKKKKSSVQYIPKQVLLNGTNDTTGQQFVAKVKLNQFKKVKHRVQPSGVGYTPPKVKPPNLVTAEHRATLAKTYGTKTP